MIAQSLSTDNESTVSNVDMSIKMSEIKPDAIYVSSCMANAKPDCPYRSAEELATVLQDKFGVEVILGTHEYP